MITAPGLKPVPLPATGTAPHEAGSPATWHDTKLVRLDYEYVVAPKSPDEAAEVKHDVFSVRGGTAYHNGDGYLPGELKKLGGPWSGNYVDPFSAPAQYSATGTSFVDAIKAANKTAKFSTSTTGHPIDGAQAVLLGGDGQYYVTTLRDGLDAVLLNPKSSATITYSLAGVEALSPDVVAVVDRDEWINFSGDTIQVDLADA